MNSCCLAVLVLLLGTLVWAADDSATPKEEDVLKLVYDRKYRVPREFFKDHAVSDPNISLYFHQDDWFSDDKDKARKIVQDFLDKPSGIEVKKIDKDGEKETPMTFDFRAGKIWFRVHKPGYFTFAGKRAADLAFGGAPNDKPVELGTFKAKLSLDSVRDLAEYHWQIQYFNLNGAKVIKSEGKELKEHIEHTLWTTQVVFGDFGLKDEISLVTVTYNVNKKDGKTTVTTKTVKKIQGKSN